MKQMLRNVVLTLAFSAFGVHSVAAQTNTFMLVPGIPGDSLVIGHENWIDVFSVAQTYEGGGRACSVAVAKGLDRSGPPLWAAAVTGQTFAEITIEITRAGEKPLRFYELKLTNARVTTIASSPSELTEHLTITGTTAKLTFWRQKQDGSLDDPVSATADCTPPPPGTTGVRKPR